MDIFKGVLINTVMCIAGGIIGTLCKNVKWLKPVAERAFQAFAFFVMMIGFSGAAKFTDGVLFLVSIVLGALAGELCDLDEKFSRLGAFAESKLSKGSNGSFAKGFVSASLMYCLGSMAFTGAIESGIQHAHTIYTTKGALDGSTAILFAMNSGISVAFASASVLVYQGLLTAGANLLAPVLTEETITMCSAVGSILLVPIGTNMLKLTDIKVANLLPAIFVPILFQLVKMLIAAFF